MILGLRPLVEAGWIDTARGIVCDCKSGVSGAGKEPKRETHFVEVNENFRAYNLFTHRHTPEVSDHLGLASKDFVFTTHLLPVERGILSTLYVWLNPLAQGGRNRSALSQILCGAADGADSCRREICRNCSTWRTRISAISDSRSMPSGERLVIVSCLDNLGKGAAGQAVQNLNGMQGYPETAGLL